MMPHHQQMDTARTVKRVTKTLTSFKKRREQSSFGGNGRWGDGSKSGSAYVRMCARGWGDS